jgi:hypothetical protein
MKQIPILLSGVLLASAPAHALLHQITVVGEFRVDPSQAVNIPYAWPGGQQLTLATNQSWQQAFYTRIVNNRTFNFTVQFDPAAAASHAIGNQNYIPATLTNAQYFLESPDVFDFSDWTAGVRFYGANQESFEILIDRRVNYAAAGRYHAASIFLISDLLGDRGDFRIHGQTVYGLGYKGVLPNAIEFGLAVIPEPSTVALWFGLAAGFVVFWRRRGARR